MLRAALERTSATLTERVDRYSAAMAIVVLVRHGRTTANASGVLAGRTAGIRLDDVGVEQAAAAGVRLSAVPLVHAVTSPLERCRQTTSAILRAQQAQAGDARALKAVSDRRLTECDYGDWQGRQLKDLAKDPLWETVQQQPSAVVFPGGEAMTAMQARAVAAVRDHDRQVEAAHGSSAVWLACSHGDVIKAVLADALGSHLDNFQRLIVDPASISIVRFTSSRPYLMAMNTHHGDLAWLHQPPPSKGRGKKQGSTDAVVGGGAGPEPASS